MDALIDTGLIKLVLCSPTLISIHCVQVVFDHRLMTIKEIKNSLPYPFPGGGFIDYLASKSVLICEYFALVCYTCRYIKPEDVGYLKLLQGLRSGDCA